MARLEPFRIRDGSKLRVGNQEIKASALEHDQRTRRFDLDADVFVSLENVDSPKLNACMNAGLACHCHGGTRVPRERGHLDTIEVVKVRGGPKLLVLVHGYDKPDDLVPSTEIDVD